MMISVKCCGLPGVTPVEYLAAALARHIDANGCTTFVTRRQFNGIVYDLNQSGDGKRYSVIDPDINPRKISMGISKYDIYLITQEAGQKMLNREDDFWTCTYRGCGAKFNDKDRLKAHLKSPKHEARMYRCPGCDKHFPDLGSACSHIEQDLPRCNLNNVKDVIREAHELIIAVTKKKKDSRTKQRLREFARILPNLRPR
ncbi:hypothetical protein EST38_g7274 [Candolleomyces aberdarensis]|uniref:C2H2-type domain-containing protein n=1 Tax=Candolleomyces aberdarensis TaxID=2316362 RepID=A0A4Q2DIV2_9AGAR|nr:hypothetical protein EST38_g7274 [Candolleomyces aberdarensis]